MEHHCFNIMGERLATYSEFKILIPWSQFFVRCLWCLYRFLHSQDLGGLQRCMLVVLDTVGEIARLRRWHAWPGRLCSLASYRLDRLLCSFQELSLWWFLLMFVQDVFEARICGPQALDIYIMFPKSCSLFFFSFLFYKKKEWKVNPV